ncbi:DNA ligase 4 [Monosporozyma servazzii]
MDIEATSTCPGPGPENFAPSPDFKWLCQELFVKIDQIKNSKEKGPTRQRYRDVITSFVQMWRSTVGSDFYPVLVLALPQRDRRTFQMKDVTLIRAVCATLHLDPKSTTQQRLLDWKSRIGSGGANRLSSICVHEISQRRREPHVDRQNRVSLDVVNDWLDQLAQRPTRSSGGVNKLVKSDLWQDIMNRLSYMELKYFFDIILKIRIMGSQENTLLFAWHPDARDYLSVVSDLHSVTQKLFDPQIRLQNDEFTLQLNSPFSPQLAKRISSTSYEKIVNKLLIQQRQKMFLIEEKMDGERLQIHYSNHGESIKYYSRRGTDYTYLYGSNLNEGPISPFLSLDPKVRDCILDGEMISFDMETNTVLPFGIVKSVAKHSNDVSTYSTLSEDVTAETESFHPLFMAFDVLFLNGKALIKYPLWQRKNYLNQILKPNPIHNRVRTISHTEGYNAEDIKTHLALAVKANSEGILLKNPQSKYIPASRNDSWIKIKPEYLDQFGENMDLIIMGKDSAVKDSFMCGIALQESTKTLTPTINLDSQHDEDVDDEMADIPTRKIIGYVSFCSIANGIAKNELQEIKNLTRGKWHNFKEDPPPETNQDSLLLQFGSKKPREWIHPKDSVILEIKARSIDNTESQINKFATKCTLYGGYCKAIRKDKDWSNCYTMEEFQRDRSFKSGHHGSVSSGSKNGGIKRRKRQPHFITDNNKLESETEVVSNLFHGINFYIISDYFNPLTKSRISRDQLNRDVIAQGGTIVYNLITNPEDINRLRIISGIYNIECNTLIERGYDIISPRWIIDCIYHKSLLSLEPIYCFNVSEELMGLARTRVDSYGDSYQITINEPILQEILQSGSHSACESLNKACLDNDMLTLPLLLFNLRKIYIPDWVSLNDPLKYNLVEWKIKLYGGTIVNTISECNLIVIIPQTGNTHFLEFEKKIQAIRSQLGDRIDSNPKSICPIPHIVSSDWVDKSIEENVQVPEESYHVWV